MCLLLVFIYSAINIYNNGFSSGEMDASVGLLVCRSDWPK